MYKKIVNAKMKKYKIGILVLIILVVLFNIGGIVAGNVIYDRVTRVQIDRNFNNYEFYKGTFDYERLENLDTENVKIKSSLGYTLSGTYINNPISTEDTIVVLHGFRGTRWESMKYADMYIDLGYNVLIYDSRYHGKSEGNDITLGYMERVDLDNCIKWVKSRNPKGIIGVHGESLGGVTALLHSKINEADKQVAFYIVDCAYSDLSDLLEFLLNKYLKAYHPFMGKILTFYCNVVVFFRSGFNLYAISPINAIKEVGTPIMFIHGEMDQYIPKTMSIAMYNIKKGAKDIYLAPGAAHSQSYLFNKEEYTSRVESFIKKVRRARFMR